MTRVFAMTILTSACIVAFLGAQGRPRVEKDGAPGDKKQAKDKKDLPVAGSGEKPEEIIKRLNENFEKSEDRLNKKDPGEDTRKTQDKIIEDLDELIKQAQNNQSGGGGGGGGASSKSSAKSNSSSGKSSSNSAGNSGKGNQSQNNSQAKNGGNQKDQKGGQDNQNDKKNGSKDPQKDKDQVGKNKGEKKDDQAAKADPKEEGKGKDGKGGGGSGTDKKEDPKKNITADMIGRDIWGHLPQKQRQEMEIYGKQRFLPKYEDLLRQYYRTISESDRRKDD